MEKQSKKKTKGLALKPTDWDMLKKMANSEGRSVNNYIENVILSHIKKTELG